MRRRAVGLVLIGSAVVPLAIVSAAYACGVLATVLVNPNTVTRGQVVTATGENYGRTDAVSPTCGGTCSPVTLRWNSRKGPIVGTDSTIDATGRISTPITIPGDAKAGENLVLATQTNANGTPKSGTPGRTTVNVQVASRTGTATSGVEKKSKQSEEPAQPTENPAQPTEKQKEKNGEAPGGAWGPPNPGGPGGGGAVVTLDDASSASPALLPTLLGVALSAGLLGTGLALVRKGRTTTRSAFGV